MQYPSGLIFMTIFAVDAISLFRSNVPIACQDSEITFLYLTFLLYPISLSAWQLLELWSREVEQCPSKYQLCNCSKTDSDISLAFLPQSWHSLLWLPSANLCPAILLCVTAGWESRQTGGIRFVPMEVLMNCARGLEDSAGAQAAV